MENYNLTLQDAVQWIALAGVLLFTWRKSGAATIATLYDTVNKLVDRVGVLENEAESHKEQCLELERDRDTWQKLAESYKGELEKAERRIEELREIIASLKKSRRKWD